MFTIFYSFLGKNIEIYSFFIYFFFFQDIIMTMFLYQNFERVVVETMRLTRHSICEVTI